MLARLRFLGLLSLFFLIPIICNYFFGNYWIRVLNFACLYIVLALGLNITVGLTGLLDLGFVAFYAVGAYIVAIFSSPHLSQNFAFFAQLFPAGVHMSIWILLPASAFVAALFGLCVGLPTLRLRGDYFTIVTLGFGEIVRILISNLDYPLNITNGAMGIRAIDAIQIFGLNLSQDLEYFNIPFSSMHLYFYLFAFLAFLCFKLNGRIHHSRVGRAWVAIRDDEVAAQAVGIPTRQLKLLAFATSAAFGGLAGGLFASFQNFVSPESFTLSESILILSMVVLGGMGNIFGVILGAIVLTVLPEILRVGVEPMQIFLLGKVYIASEIVKQLLYGGLMIVIMLYRPSGLWPVRSSAYKI